MTKVRLNWPLDALLKKNPHKSAGWFQGDPDNNVWCLSVEVPDTVRTTYFFDVYRGDDAEPARTLDAGNPKQFAAKIAEGRGSLLELPAAPPQPWRRSDATGKWEKRDAPAPGGGSQMAYVYLPSGYSARGTEPYSLILGLSSISLGLMIPTDKILDYLGSRYHSRRSILVLFDVAQSKSSASLDSNAEFVASTMIPWIRSNYYVSTRPSDISLIGASWRGLTAAYTAFRHPEAIGNVLSLSGAYYWGPDGRPSSSQWFSHLVAARPRSDVRYFLAAGAFETLTTTENRGLYPLATTKHLARILRRRGYSLCTYVFPGGHSEVSWEEAIFRGLRCLEDRRLSLAQGSHDHPLQQENLAPHD